MEFLNNMDFLDWFFIGWSAWMLFIGFWLGKADEREKWHSFCGKVKKGSWL